MAALPTHHSPPCFLSPPFPKRNHLSHFIPLQFKLRNCSPNPRNLRNMKTEMAMAVVVAVLVGSLAVEGKQAPAPAVDCSTLVLGMADCVTFVSNGSTVAKPEGNCCSGLKTVLRTDAQCLCDAFKNSASLGVALNLTKALALPTACHVSAPSAKNCGVSLSPSGAPVASPAGAPEASIANAPGAGFGASEVSPSPTPGKNASPVVGVSLGSVILCLVGAIFASFSRG